jgi:hypothetical protein
VITDEMLKEAAGELENAMLAQMPDPKECQHDFSPRFERKMKKLIHRVDHPITASLGFRIAAVILAILLLGGSVLLISDDAKALFLGWVREERTGGIIRYVAHSDIRPESVPARFRLESEPEGYTLWRYHEDIIGEGFVYINDDETKLLSFQYFIITKNSGCTVQMETQGYIHKRVLINGSYADMTISKYNWDTSRIVWRGYDGAVVFSINGFLSEEELIYMAEHIVPVEDNS